MKRTSACECVDPAADDKVRASTVRVASPGAPGWKVRGTPAAGADASAAGGLEEADETLEHAVAATRTTEAVNRNGFSFVRW